MFSTNKDWVDISSALLTPAIALFAVFIACLQWKSHQNQVEIEKERFKHDLFERRIETFHEITTHISQILQDGKAEMGGGMDLLRKTKDAIYLFDKRTDDYIHEIYDKSNKLAALGIQAEKLDADSDPLKKNLDEQERIRNWFMNEINHIRERFGGFLRLNNFE